MRWNVLIRKSTLEPFGVVGIPFIRPILDISVIEASLFRLKGHLRGMTPEDIRESLEAAVIICGANTASCEIRSSNPRLGYEHNVIYVLKYILHGSDRVHSTTL